MQRKKIVIRKPDLDTCLTALICGVTCEEPIEVVNTEADTDSLNSPEILCIEAGGCGQVSCNNFDHHGSDGTLPPACRQALYHHCHAMDQHLQRLVAYVCQVDLAVPILPPVAFPSLSNIFSGMRMTCKSYQKQFFNGLALLHTVYTERIDPFAAMPDRKEWRSYRKAKTMAQYQLDEALNTAHYCYSRGGLSIGFVEASVPGILGALYKKGCQIAVAFNPTIKKYTVGSRQIAVANLLPELAMHDFGWGGHSTIIGSSIGSRLGSVTLIKLIQTVL